MTTCNICCNLLNFFAVRKFYPNCILLTGLQCFTDGRSWCLFLCTGVVVDDSPTLWKASKDQRKNTAHVPACPSQMPVAQNQSGVGPKSANFEPRKVKFPHGGPIGIALAVAL